MVVAPRTKPDVRAHSEDNDDSTAGWTVPDADGRPRCFIDYNSFEYRSCPLKMNVVDHGYKAVADKVWWTTL